MVRLVVGAICILVAINLAKADTFGKFTITDFLEAEQTACMATNIYHEARNESEIGQRAIAFVVLNRVNSPDYPSTVCDVVYEAETRPHWKTGKPVPRRNRCQFSWYCDGKKDIVWISYMDGTPIESNATAWRDSINVALFVMTGELRDVTNGADHYYNYNISNPYWVGAMTETAVIGNHRFMKENR